MTRLNIFAASAAALAFASPASAQDAGAASASQAGAPAGFRLEALLGYDRSGVDGFHESGVLYGVGVGYNFTPNITARLEAQKPSSDTSNVSGTLSLKF